ncbi:hypothetical protein BO78DRAFT_90581 [Aspergillus sclerotiicarbonarius CBS 121057]|uniref:NACHT domain-containing protein n=1 Tax=Aspergillus sclerotiicarbonarius (strain CBS 121057 / IBT 28362) TaxID=1448318 RepID=A0A319ETW9_ASPSB|nr:hypothetical protein BO78DRAFT_90581 [Aspergillus sclerotiicarbonarius CBS 121057]
MTDPSPEQHDGFRHKLRQILHLRSRSRDPSHKPRNHQTDLEIASRHSRSASIARSSSTSISHTTTLTANSLALIQASDGPKETCDTGNQTGHSTLHTNTLERNLTVGDDIRRAVVSSDLWSAAYREAVENLQEKLDINALEGKTIAQLFKDLEKTENEVTHESAFLRGLKCLQTLKVPLERFKMALDVASPLADIKPTTKIVVGVIKSVTAIAISLASVDVDFAKKIADMLEQIQYIDDCDTLGQKAERKDIHKALVSVYQKILEFYNAAVEFLSRKGARLIAKMVLENDRLPKIVEGFLRCSDTPRKLVEKAIFEITDDIRCMLYDHEIDRWLGSEQMRRQSQYHADLQELRADQACDSLLKSPQFLSWYHASDSQQLVILGDMGSGKIVSMSFVVDELSRRNEYQLPQPKICFYYCRDDETGKSSAIFSALILSLLKQLPGLKNPFVEWYKQAQASGVFDPASNIKRLEGFLQNVLEATDRPIFIAIDGLDECDTTSRMSLLKTLKSLSQNIPGVKTILSTRPQEEILEELHNMPRIELKHDALRDRIIVEKTVENQLPHLSMDVRALVIERLSHLAQGSAIWTKMIIRLIKIRKIRAFNPMRCFLDEIPLPRQLSELYTTLISRCIADDPENQMLANAALKLLATTHTPFSILELSWAVALSVAQHVSTVDELARLVDHQRVMELIHPFIACVDFSDTKKRQVRLTHQSVKEFIMREWCNKTCSQRPDLADADLRFASPEAFILGVCTRYLLLDEIDSRHLFSKEQVAIAELPQEADLFDENREPVEYDPHCTWEAWEEDMIRFDPTDRGFGEFFVYASCYWLEYFGAITAETLPNLANIEDLCRAGSTRLRNWTQQNCRPGCAISPRFPFDSQLYDPLSITSLYGSVDMLHHMLRNSNFDQDKFLENPAMSAADQILQWGEMSRLRVLLCDDRLGHQLRNLEFFRLIIKRWHNSSINRPGWGDAFALVDDVSAQMVDEQWANELLCTAASAGCMPIVRRLITSAQQKEGLRRELLREFRNKLQETALEEPMHQSIGEAVLANHIDVVKYLLKENNIEAHLRYRNRRGENVLHLASKLCNPEMFRLLAPRFLEGIHQADDRGDTVLERIVVSPSASRNRYESAKILLSQNGVNWNNHSWDRQRNPLRMAVQLCDLDMCCLLICIGKMDPITALRCKRGDHVDLKYRTRDHDENMLDSLVRLFDAEAAMSQGSSMQYVSSLTEETLRHLAEKHYHSRFGTLAGDSHTARRKRH